jgi:methyl-accepting chemotaxis protein
VHRGLLASTDPVAVGVTVVATLVVAGLVMALIHLLRAARQVRDEAEALAQEAAQLLDEIGQTVREAGAEVYRVERMVGSAEAISDAVGAASRLVGGAVGEPLIKFVSVVSGIARVVQALRRRPSGRHIAAVSHERRRPLRSSVPAKKAVLTDAQRASGGRA